MPGDAGAEHRRDPHHPDPEDLEGVDEGDAEDPRDAKASDDAKESDDAGQREGADGRDAEGLADVDEGGADALEGEDGGSAEAVDEGGVDDLEGEDGGSAEAVDEGGVDDLGVDGSDAEDLAGVAPVLDGPIAVFEDVSRAYGDIEAIKGLDLRLDGTCIGLLGPNGAGKTTLIRMLMGLIPPTSGRIEVLGMPASPAVRRHIGYVPEGRAVFPGMTGIAAVAHAGRLVGMRHADAIQRAHQVLDYVGLGDERYRLAETYSTGMRQRLKLAQALVHDPDLLILDEPTEGVDPRSRDQILELIAELGQEHGIRSIISTHLLADVERLASHAIVLDQGRIVVHGSVDALQRQGASGHVVRVNEDPSRLTSHLDAQGVSWTSMAPDIRIDLDDPLDVLRHVAAAGLVVRHLAPVRMRLDEAFEQALGGHHA